MFCGLRNVKYGNKDMHFCILLLIMTNSFGGVLNKVKYIILGGKNGNFSVNKKKKKEEILYLF